MAGFLTLSPRGTDVVLAALQLNRRFSRDDLVESYGRLRMDRDGALPQHWSQGVSNEIQRLGSEFSRYKEEGRKLDLIARFGRGQYSIRDAVRPLLLTAANERSDLLKFSNTLLVPSQYTNGNDAATHKYNHLVGTYAQLKLMAWARQENNDIIEDTASTRSYDFLFRKRGVRHETPQVMESKGTRRSEIDVALTPNEYTAWIRNAHSYWLGIVYNIEIVDGQARGGSDPFVTPPPILNRWQIVSGFKLRRIKTEANLVLL